MTLRPRGAEAVRRPLAVVSLILGLVLLVAAPATAQGDGPLVDVLEVRGVIDQSMADYVADVIDQANADGAEAIVLQLDTPGGLGVSMDAIVERIRRSDVPVVVWVGPAGASALSAGTYIAYASHLLFMAPGTTIGAATPVDLGGGDLEDKATNAAVGALVLLAEATGRDADFAAEAVEDGAVVAVLPADAPPGAELPEGTELPARVERGDVVALPPHELVDERVADDVASSLPEVLAALDGREVLVPGSDGQGGTRVLDVDPALANVRFNNLGLVRRVLHTVANPTLAYLLLIVGALSMLFEIFQPGFGVAGVTGLVLFGLALYGLSVLPVNWLAFALVLLGLALLAVDLAVAGLGALTAGGAIALAVGSFLLFDGVGVLRLSPWLIGAVVAGNLVFFVVVMTTVLRAQSHQAMTGAEALAGKVAVVRSMLNPEGHVFVDGALWRARAPEDVGKVKVGTRVRVLGLNDRMTLDVELTDTDEASPVG